MSPSCVFFSSQKKNIPWYLRYWCCFWFTFKRKIIVFFLIGWRASYYAQVPLWTDFFPRKSQNVWSYLAIVVTSPSIMIALRDRCVRCCDVLRTAAFCPLHTRHMIRIHLGNPGIYPGCPLMTTGLIERGSRRL